MGLIDRLPFMSRKSLAEPNAELLALFGAGPSQFGVTTGQALAVPAVQSSVRLISEAAASLDIKVVRRVGDVEAEVTDHPVARLFAEGPNDWTDTYSFVRDMVSAALTSDKGGVAFVNRVSDRIVELVRYEDSAVTVEYTTDGRAEPRLRTY